MTLPVIGCALGVPALPEFRDWILEKQRDVELQGFHMADVLNGDWSALVDSAKTHLAGHTGRLGIHGPFWGFNIASQDPDVQAVVAKRLDQGLQVCTALGATHMVIHSPVTTWDQNNLPNYDTGFETMAENLHACIGKAVARAQDQGTILVMENIEDVNPDTRKALVENIDSDALRLSIDTGHAQYAHGSTGAPPVDYFVKSAGALLEHVHLQDADGYADRHWALGEGNIHWHAVFRAIAALSQRPRLLLEMRQTNSIAKSMAYLSAQGLGQ